MAQVVEHLPGKCKALSSISNTANTIATTTTTTTKIKAGKRRCELSYSLPGQEEGDPWPNSLSLNESSWVGPDITLPGVSTTKHCPFEILLGLFSSHLLLSHPGQGIEGMASKTHPIHGGCSYFI
jgi:hypothetical protein